MRRNAELILNLTFGKQKVQEQNKNPEKNV
jgi:hypothetical protein